MQCVNLPAEIILLSRCIDNEPPTLLSDANESQDSGTLGNPRGGFEEEVLRRKREDGAEQDSKRDGARANLFGEGPDGCGARRVLARVPVGGQQGVETAIRGSRFEFVFASRGSASAGLAASAST